jgi:hypothetical protein
VLMALSGGSAAKNCANGRDRQEAVTIFMGVTFNSIHFQFNSLSI